MPASFRAADGLPIAGLPDLNVRLPGPLARCADYARLIGEAEMMKHRVRTEPKFLKKIIADHVLKARELRAEIENTDKMLKNADASVLLGLINSLASAALFAVGFFVSEPVAITLFVVGVVGGAVSFALAAANANDPTASGLVGVYTRDRALFIGEHIAGQSNHLVLSKSLGIISVLVSVFDLKRSGREVDQLRSQLAILQIESKQIAGLMAQYPHNAETAWQSLIESDLNATLRGLKKHIEKYKLNDCIFLPAGGPVIQPPP